jgi:hypothetical protein
LPIEKEQLLAMLSSCDPGEFHSLVKRAGSASLRRVLRHYLPLPKDEEAHIWRVQHKSSQECDVAVPDDERVEDAGLQVDDERYERSRREAVVA